MKDTFNRKDISTIVLVVIASFLCAVNINTFINAGGLFPGGFTGLTVFIQRYFKQYLDIAIPYAPVYYLLNAIPAFIGFKMVGKKFTIFSCLMIFLTGLFADMMPNINVTEDVLLITIFGGILQGVALGICLLYTSRCV